MEGRGQRRRIDALDQRWMIAFAQPAAHRVELLSRALDLQLDRAVQAVADPAGEPARACFADDRFAKADALHMTPHPKQPAFNHLDTNSDSGSILGDDRPQASPRGTGEGRAGDALPASL